MNSVYYHFHNSEYFFETAMSGGRKKQKFADSAELFLSPTYPHMWKSSEFRITICNPQLMIHNLDLL